MQDLAFLEMPVKEVYIYIFDLIMLDVYRTKSRGGLLQGSVIYFLSQLFAARPVKTSMQING